MQGKEFPEEQVELLLAGKYRSWVPLVQKLEFWTDDVLPGDSTFQGTFANLHGMNQIAPLQDHEDAEVGKRWSSLGEAVCQASQLCGTSTKDLC